MQVLIGFGFAVIVAVLAWRAGALSISGAWAAALTGGLIFGLGGLPWAALLLVFFITSSGLSRLFKRRKAALDEKFAKGSQRDWGQVLANGGLGALLAALAAVAPQQTGLWWAAFAGAMAAVNADTWATELGVLSRTAPRLITTWAQVERGTSGGVSLAGYLAAAGGAAVVALGAVLVLPSETAGLVFLAALLGGLVGSTVDSLLGATVQAIYYCPACAKETERHPQHTCGAATTQQRGWNWLNNDAVNLICSLAGAAASAVTWALLAG